MCQNIKSKEAFQNKIRSFQVLVISFASLVSHCHFFREHHNCAQNYSLSEMFELGNIYLDALKLENWWWQRSLCLTVLNSTDFFVIIKLYLYCIQINVPLLGHLWQKIYLSIILVFSEGMAVWYQWNNWNNQDWKWPQFVLECFLLFMY